MKHIKDRATRWMDTRCFLVIKRQQIHASIKETRQSSRAFWSDTDLDSVYRDSIELLIQAEVKEIEQHNMKLLKRRYLLATRPSLTCQCCGKPLKGE